MLQVRTNFFICERLEDLPNLKFSDKLYADAETQRVFDHDKLGGLYPWKGDRVCGIGVTADEIKKIWYVPIRHTCPEAVNLPVEPVMEWFQSILNTTGEWVNHNVKFDATMFAAGDGLTIPCGMVDTIVQAKLHNSDRMAYGLKPLCGEVLGYDTGSLDRVKAYLDSIKSRSYADVPIDILGEYCCDDVQMNRELHHYLDKEMDSTLDRIWSIERKLTPVLFDMEMRGVCIDPHECIIEGTKSMRRMIRTSTRIAELTKIEFTNSVDCIYDILVNQLGLPVLATIKEKEGREWVDTGRPSFDKEALALYRVHPAVTYDPTVKEIVDCIATYRKESTFHGLYIENFLGLHVDNVIHPSYNQVVRTGRMSCSRPNSQQQNSRSKRLIHPHPGYGFVSNDYSQIEYRLIVHYIRDEAAIKAYNENPDTDFHKWVAELLGGIDRDGGKTLNFGMAYGAGKRKVTSGLTANEKIAELLTPKIHEMVANGTLDSSMQDKKFKELCAAYANDAYERYHETLPGIKATSRTAIQNAKLRGYVFTAYKRRRHLSPEFCYKAFNSVIQGTAADIMKERMNALAPRYNAESRKLGLFVVANVHDENLDEVPLEILHDKQVWNFICDTLQETEIPFRVPIRTGLGISPDNWAEAAGKGQRMDKDGNVIAGKIL